MKKFIILALLIFGCSETNSDIIKIIKAKEKVKHMHNYPDTVDFHDMETKVSGDYVTLKVTAKNGFGVPSTETFTIRVD